MVKRPLFFLLFEKGIAKFVFLLHNAMEILMNCKKKAEKDLELLCVLHPEYNYHIFAFKSFRKFQTHYGKLKNNNTDILKNMH